MHRMMAKRSLDCSSASYVEAGEKAMRLGVIGHSWEGAGGERKDMVHARHGKGAALRLLLAR